MIGKVGKPQFYSNRDYKHGTPEKVGVLLVNLGTPDSPTPRALKRYLKEFLSDPRVVEIPRVLWWPILNLIILNIRPKKSAEKYLSVWTEDGSPLLVNSKLQAKGLKNLFNERDNCQKNIIVELAMRYGNPSIESALEKMAQDNVGKLVVLPLYPQFSASTTATVFDKVFTKLSKFRNPPAVRLIKSYHDQSAYVQAVANKVAEFWNYNGRPSHLLFSFHGVPIRSLYEGDPYHCQCQKTARLVADELNLKEGEWTISFQSRFGKAEWLKPYTTATIQKLAKEDGVKKLDVVCPGFLSDCLETLEEIDMEAREDFLDAGGENFRYIPCLNGSSQAVEMLAEIAIDEMASWATGGGRKEPDANELIFQKHRATALGAKN